MNSQAKQPTLDKKLTIGIAIGIVITLLVGAVFYFGLNIGKSESSMSANNDQELVEKVNTNSMDDNMQEDYDENRNPQTDFAYAKNGSIWKANVERNQPERIIEDTNAQNPVLSPDGTKILYFSLNEDYKKRVEMSNETPLPFPINYDLWLVNADGSNKVNVLQYTESQEILPYNTRWSPDSRHFVTSTNTNESKTDVFIYDSEADQKAIIPMSVETNMTANREILWSPDSNMIAIFGMPVDQYIPGVGNPIWNRTLVYDTEGTLIEKNDREGVPFLPSLWSPYDKSIYVLFVGNGIGSYALYKDDISGSELTFVTGVEDPADISKRNSQNNSEIVDKIFEETALLGGDTIFSPDGTMLVSIKQDMYLDKDDSPIWMMDIDGTSVRQVISDNQELNENRDLFINPVLILGNNEYVVLDVQDSLSDQKSVYSVSLSDGTTREIDSWVE